jgi:succinate dehydrogenase/fumarate reductase cytochrome b subunit
MQTFIFVLIVAAAIATLYILVRGVMTMAQGKDITGERSQALMRKRVLFQGIAIVFVVLFLLLASGGRS